MPKILIITNLPFFFYLSDVGFSFLIAVQMRLLLTKWIAWILRMKFVSNDHSAIPEATDSNESKRDPHTIAMMMTSKHQYSDPLECSCASIETCCLPLTGWLNHSLVHPATTNDDHRSYKHHCHLHQHPPDRMQPKSSELLLDASRLVCRSQPKTSDTSKNESAAMVSTASASMATGHVFEVPTTTAGSTLTMRHPNPIASSGQPEITSHVTTTTSIASSSSSKPGLLRSQHLLSSQVPPNPLLLSGAVTSDPGASLSSSRSIDDPHRWMPLSTSAILSSPIVLVLRSLLHELRYVSNRLRDRDQLSMVLDEWKFAARVLDRLCFLCFLLFTVGCTGLFLVSANIQDV